jgi:hypothetical protein
MILLAAEMDAGVDMVGFVSQLAAGTAVTGAAGETTLEELL